MPTISGNIDTKYQIGERNTCYCGEDFTEVPTNVGKFTKEYVIIWKE